MKDDKLLTVLNTVEVVMGMLLFIFIAAADSEFILVPVIGVLVSGGAVYLIELFKQTFHEEKDDIFE
jgi:hypothetical protein